MSIEMATAVIATQILLKKFGLLPVDAKSPMLRAIELSRNCVTEPGKKTPAPKVGAVLVKDDKIIGEAYRGETGEGDHGEFALLQKKLIGKDVRGATLYTTLEPCTIRNPPKRPCCEWIIEAGIGLVVIGMLDPNPEVCGLGQLKLRKAKIKVAHFDPDLVPEIEEINREFSDQYPLEERLRIMKEMRTIPKPGDLGPNGQKTGFDEEGNFVEWIEDEDDEENKGELWGMVLRRSDAAISEMYQELWDMVWWNRHQYWLHQLETGEETLLESQRDILETAKKAAKRIENKYGKENLGWNDIEWGILQGKLSALSWVLGSEWEESMDT